MATETAEETSSVWTYPKDEQKARWQERAEEKDRTMSGFVQDMVELGMKVDRGIDVALQPDETNQDLREQRDDMKAEVDRLRERVAELEDQLHDTEQTVTEASYGR